MPVRSAWLINRTETESGQSRADTRLAPVGTMAPSGALTSAGGVIPGSENGAHLMSALYVYGETAGMRATVAPGRAVIQGRGPAGAYPVVLTDYADVGFVDGNAANPRIDVVILRVHDAQFDGEDGRTEAVLEVVQGEASASPEPPLLPPASLPLAQVRIPAGASAGTGGIDWANAIYDLRVPTVAVGGILPESWARDVPGGYIGQYRDTATEYQRWDGARWTGYPRQIGGIAPRARSRPGSTPVSTATRAGGSSAGTALSGGPPSPPPPGRTTPTAATAPPSPGWRPSTTPRAPPSRRRSPPPSPARSS